MRNDQTTKPILRGSELAVLSAPFCGWAPGSNRWGDVEYILPDGAPAGFDGDDVATAMRGGWLWVEQLDQPGHSIDDPEDGGIVEFYWRYHAVPAFKTIIISRAMRAGLEIPK